MNLTTLYPQRTVNIPLPEETVLPPHSDETSPDFLGDPVTTSPFKEVTIPLPLTVPPLHLIDTTPVTRPGSQRDPERQIRSLT